MILVALDVRCKTLLVRGTVNASGSSLPVPIKLHWIITKYLRIELAFKSHAIPLWLRLSVWPLSRLRRRGKGPGSAWLD